MRISLSTAVWAFYFAAIYGNAQASEGFVSSGDHARPSTSDMVSYSAQCPRTGYEIRISKKSSLVQFVVKDGADRVEKGRSFDISATQFGKPFLRKNLY